MAVAVLFTTSCVKEDISSSIANGETVEVTFTANLPELGTRATTYGNGNSARTLQFFVYEYQDEDGVGTYLPDVKMYTADNNEGTNIISSETTHFNFSLSLIKGMKYNIVFWADKGAGSPYSVDRTGYVTVNYENASANDDSRDAFFGVLKNFDPAAADAPQTARDIKLTRPFAQLNAATLDLTDVQNSGIVLSTLTSSVKVENAYTTLNIFNGEVSNPTLATFAATVIPATNGEVLPGKSEYGYLSMNYVLVNTKELVETTFTFYGKRHENDSDENKVKLAENKYTGVPLQRNYRTNILGKLITKSTDFEVEILPGFGGDHNSSVIVPEDGRLETLITNEVYAQETAQIILESDVTWTTGASIGSTPLIPEDAALMDLVIEGGVASRAEEQPVITFVGKGVGAVRAANGGTITFRNVKIVDQSVSYAENNWEYGYLEFGGNLKFENCTFVNAIMVEGQGANASFTNCYFNSNKENEYALWVSAGNVSVKNSTIEGWRGFKTHEAYGSEVVSVAIDECDFTLTKKPGLAIGDVNAETAISIKNSTFNTAAGDQGLYFYETDTDVNTFNFTLENNKIANSVIVPENNTQDVVVSANDTTNVTVPADEAQAGDNYKVVISDENSTTDSATGKTTVDFDLTLYKNDVEVSGDVIYVIAKNIGADLFITQVTHNGNNMTEATSGADQTYTYNSATGVLTIYTKSFSPFAVTYIDSKDYVRKLNAGHNKNSTISVSTGADFLPIVAVNPAIYGYSVYDGDTRIANAVTFRFSKVKKETIDENCYKVSLNLAVLDENGNELEIKDGRMNPYIQTDPREHLNVYMNLMEVPAGYAISQVKVGDTVLTPTQNTSGDCATGEYWIASNPKDLYFQSRTAGLIEVTVAKAN